MKNVQFSKEIVWFTINFLPLLPITKPDIFAPCTAITAAASGKREPSPIMS
jgi:hypothetical protein